MKHTMQKVINGLRICFMQKTCDGCPYQKELKAILDKPHNDDWHCPILDDAISMLKQEAVEPLFNKRMNYFVCPNCSLVLDEMRDDYCPSCGKRIAWGEYYIHEDETEGR